MAKYGKISYLNNWHLFDYVTSINIEFLIIQTLLFKAVSINFTFNIYSFL